MSLGLYADVHVPGPVILQLRLRGVDILAATEEEANELPDSELLALATSLQRAMVTQDIRFRVLAEDWQRTGRTFAGLIFAHQRYVSFGQMIFDWNLSRRRPMPNTGGIAWNNFRCNNPVGRAAQAAVCRTAEAGAIPARDSNSRA